MSPAPSSSPARSATAAVLPVGPLAALRPRLPGLLLLALAAALGWHADARLFLGCWLAAWWWALGLVLGAQVQGWLHALTGGRWGAALAPARVALARRLPSLLPGLLPIALGLRTLYPWARDPAWADALAHPAFVRVWLSPDFVLPRLALYALLWWGLARPWHNRGGAAAALLLHGLVSSLAAVDLLMSLQAPWTSTAFALVALAAQALGGAALLVALTAHARPGLAPGRPPLWRDLGNLLLMWVLLWAYVAFMQLLVIWAENLPREVVWYVPRLQTGWLGVGWALVALQLALPLLALLWRAVKERPPRLAAVATLLVATTALDAAWLVLPSVDAHATAAGWLAPLCFAGMGGWLLGGLARALRHGPPPQDRAEAATASGLAPTAHGAGGPP